MILSTTVISSKEVSYCINSRWMSFFEERVGRLEPIGKKIYDETQFKKVVYSPNQLNEMQLSMFIKKDNMEMSILKMIYNKLRGM